MDAVDFPHGDEPPYHIIERFQRSPTDAVNRVSCIETPEES